MKRTRPPATVLVEVNVEQTEGDGVFGFFEPMGVVREVNGVPPTNGPVAFGRIVHMDVDPEPTRYLAD